MKLFFALVFLGLIYCSFSSPLTRKDSSTKPKDGKIENVRIDDILRDYWTARKPRNVEPDEEVLNTSLNVIKKPSYKKQDAVPSSVKTDEDTPTPPHTKDATEPPHAKDTPKPTPHKNDPKPTPDSKPTPDETGGKDTPGKTGDKETPDKTGDKEAPDKTGDKEAPDKIDYVWTSKPYYTKETNIWGRKVWKEGGYRTTDKPYYTESIHNWKDSTYRTKEKDNGYESDYYKMTTKPVYYDRFGGRAWGKATKQKSKKLPQYYWNNHMSYWYDFKTTTAPWRSWDNYESTRGYNYNNYVRWKYDSYEQESSTIPVIILSCLLVVFAFVILFLSRKKLTEIVTGKRNSNTMNSRSLAMNVEEARPLMRQYTI